MPHLCHVVSLSTNATADLEMRRVGFYGLTNYRNLYPTRRTKGLIGIVSAVGEQRNPKVTNGGTDISASSKIILLFRKFLPARKYGTLSDHVFCIGTKLRTRLKEITTAVTRMLLSGSYTGQETAFECSDRPRHCLVIVSTTME